MYNNKYIIIILLLFVFLCISGKMCILDCAPQSLKLLHNSSEFLPYVVMITAPGIEQLKNLTHASNRNLTVSCEIFI